MFMADRHADWLAQEAPEEKSDDHTPASATYLYSGIIRVGHLGRSHPNDGGFRPDDVCRLMNQLWIEYVAAHPKTISPDCQGGEPESVSSAG